MAANPQGNQSSAQPQGNITFSPRLLIEKHKSKLIWLIGLVILVFIVSCFWFGWKKVISFILAYLSVAILVISFFIIMILGFLDDEDKKSSKFIAFAFLIWFFDLIPSGIPFMGWLGPSYSGFKFSLLGVVNTNWMSVFASILILGSLGFKAIREMVRSNLFISSMCFLLFWILTFFIQNFAFLNYGVQIKYLGWGFLAVCILFFGIAFYHREKLGTETAEFLTFLFMMLVFSFFYVNDNWKYTTRAIFHVIYILAFGFLYIREKEKDNPSNWHLLIPALLIADFYLYNLFSNSEIGFIQAIPVLVLFVVFYCREKSQTSYSQTAVFFIAILFIVSLLPATTFASESALYEAKPGVDYKEILGSFGDRIRQVIEGRLDFATAGLYRGSVEKNQYESLGVYFANLRAADPRFYTDEPITLWGTVRSKTYQDAVIINFTCYRQQGEDRIRADRIIPSIKFPIFTLDNVDTECTFLPKKDDSQKIRPGMNSMIFSAEYNFGTDAYLKTYFMDRNSFRAYSRENIDPLAALKIQDKSPAPIFTNGPVEIGVKAGPLITVSDGYEVKPSIGITLTNRQEITDKDKNIITRWEGRIKNITELVILVPPGISIPVENCKSAQDPEGLNCPCSMPFVDYGIGKCQTSCKVALETCTQACTDAYKNANDATGSAKKNCVNECTASRDKCNSDCDYLFKPDDSDNNNIQGNYHGYALDVGSEKFIDLNKDIDKHRSFECRLDVTSGVLDNTPITTKYFRVRARYNYVIENTIPITVEEPSVKVLSSQEETFRTAVDSIKLGKSFGFSGFDPNLIVAIAMVESSGKHCCQEGYKGPGQPCYRSDVKDCPHDRIHRSSTSFGIMQIRYDTQSIVDEVNNRAKRVCETDQIIYNFDCNIKVGIDILKEKYDTYKDGCKSTSMWTNWEKEPDPAKKQQIWNKYKTFLDGCANGVTSTGVRYDSYKGTEAAVRAYNGWGRDSRFDVDYVEKVKKAFDKISKDPNDETGIKDLLGSRSGSGMVLDENVNINQQTDINLPSPT